jgi:hypothetical protein
MGMVAHAENWRCVGDGVGGSWSEAGPWQKARPALKNN